MIKKIVLFSIFCMVIFVSLVLAEEKHTTWEPTPEERTDRSWFPHGPDEVLIGRTGVSMPLGRILLARKGGEYCALIFTNTWLGERKNDHYTSYEFYYQSDGSGELTKSNVMSGTGELFFPQIDSFLHFYGYQKGLKDTITCGEMKFEWLFIAWIRFLKTEFAPTPWTSIEDVNINDPRIKWYKKDSKRDRMSVSIDRLWDKPVDEKKQPADEVEPAKTGSK
jgi:hypothetical protein